MILSSLDEKNLQALAYWGPEYVLTKFVNLAEPSIPQDTKAADEFKDTFGELYPGLHAMSYFAVALVFRYHWEWKAKSAVEHRDTSAWLTNIFNRRIVIQRPDGREEDHDTSVRPALNIEFPSGRITIMPETLLDSLAKEFLDHRYDLAICERTGCATRYFVKAHSRQRYCSVSCFRDSRLDKKNQWWKENRGKNAKHPTSKSPRTKKSVKRGRR